MTDRDVQIELNFIDEFELSRQGMIDEIKTEFDIIRFCVSNMTKYKISAREMFDRIMIMPLRKLLCEKNSVLLKVCPDFKMFPLDGQDTALNDGLHAVLLPFYQTNALQNHKDSRSYNLLFPSKHTLFLFRYHL